MLKQIKNAVLIATGAVCVVLGVIGLILPLVPGIPFLLMSAACFNNLEA